MLKSFSNLVCHFLSGVSSDTLVRRRSTTHDLHESSSSLHNSLAGSDGAVRLHRVASHFPSLPLRPASRGGYCVIPHLSSRSLGHQHFELFDVGITLTLRPFCARRPGARPHSPACAGRKHSRAHSLENRFMGCPQGKRACVTAFRISTSTHRCEVMRSEMPSDGG